MVKLTLVPRGRHFGRPIDPRTGEPVEVAETDHFYRCECGSWVDCRDLGWSSATGGRCLIRPRTGTISAEGARRVLVSTTGAPPAKKP
jgi:hypothetical protein